MAQTTIYQGAVAPETFQLTVSAGTSGVDLTTVSGASFKVKLPDGTTTTWSATTSGATVSSIVVSHTLVSGDTTQTGTYYIYATLTVPGGTVRSVPVAVAVVDAYLAPS